MSTFSYLYGMGGSTSCIDNEGSQGITVAGADCEASGTMTAAFIMNEAGSSEPQTTITGGYVQLGVGACAELNNGFLTTTDIWWQNCSATIGSTPWEMLNVVGDGSKGSPGDAINLSPSQYGLMALVSSASTPGLAIYGPTGPCVELKNASSDYLTVADCNNSTTAFYFEVYGNETVVGNLAAADYAVGSNVVIPSTVTGYQGTSGTKVQLGVGSPTAGHCANFAADGSIEDAGGPCVSQTSNAITFANSAASQDYIVLQPGTGSTDQLGAFEFANYAGTSEWELRKDSLEVFHLRDTVNGADRLLAYQGGQTMINSAGTSAVVVNDTSGAGTGGFIVYGGGSSPAAALTVSSSGNTTAAGFVSGKFYTGNSAMTFTAGAGAGTSPTIACATNCTGAQGTYRDVYKRQAR